jgi:hypothetical protein
VHLDLDSRTKFGRNLEHAASGREVDTQLAQLNAVPLIATLEAREAPFLISMDKERFQSFGKPLGKALDGRGRNVCATTPLKQRGQVVLAQELARLRIVLLLALQHLVVDMARLRKARIQAAALLSVWVQAILIRSHSFNSIRIKVRVQHLFWTEAAKASEALISLGFTGSFCKDRSALAPEGWGVESLPPAAPTSAIASDLTSYVSAAMLASLIPGNRPYAELATSREVYGAETRLVYNGVMR